MRLKRQVWELNPGPLETPREVLRRDLGQPLNDGLSRPKWRIDKYRGVYQITIQLDKEEDSDIVRIQIDGHNYFIFASLIAVIPLLSILINADTVVPILVSAFLVLISVNIIFSPTFDFRDIYDAHIRAFDKSSFPFLFGILIIAVAWLRIRPLIEPYPVDIFSILAIVLYSGYCFSLNMVPYSSDSLHTTPFIIPVMALQRFWFSLAVFSSVSMVAGYFHIRVDIINRYIDSLEPGRINASVAADVMGGYQGTLLPIQVLGIYSLAFILLYLFAISEGLLSGRVLSLLKASRSKPFKERRNRNILLVAFVFSNITILALFLPVISIISTAITGQRLLPGAQYYTDLFVGNPIQLETTLTKYSLADSSTQVETISLVDEPLDISSEELVRRTMIVLGEILPFSQYHRFISVAFLLGLLIFPLLLVVKWMIELPLSLVKKLLLLADCEDVTGEFERGTGDCEVLVASDGQNILVNPLSIMFGFKQYIILGRTVYKRLEHDELRAVIAHEEYHVNNRDLQIGSFAKILSFCVGGKNALLAFYNYPQIEQDADRYAANVVGKSPMIIAIDKIDRLRYEVGTRNYMGEYPGLLGDVSVPGADQAQSSTDTKNSALRKVLGSFRRYWNWVISGTNADQLFFGNLLLYRAHDSPEVRIERLKSL